METQSTSPVSIVNHLPFAIAVYGLNDEHMGTLPAATQLATVETVFEQLNGMWHIVPPEVWLANMHLDNLVIAGEQAFNLSPFSSICPVPA
ncbi:hypothetical protein BH10PAT2_BH10PAT2_0360 [soil metagenome]